MTKTTPDTLSVPITASGAYNRLLSLLKTEEDLLTSLERTQTAQKNLPIRLRQNIGDISLLDTANSLRAAVVLGNRPQSAAEMTEKFSQLQALNGRIEAARGEPALWFNSTADLYQIESHGPLKTRVEHSLSVGYLDPNASIRVSSEAALSAPLTSGLEVSVYDIRAMKEAIDPESPFTTLRVVHDEAPGRIGEMNIQTFGGLKSFIFIAGEAAINEALAEAPPDTQNAVNVLRDELNSTLF